MFQLFRLLTAQQLFVRQVPALAASVAIAEVFFKFHSFTLECGAFLLTWFAVDGLIQLGASLARATRRRGLQGTE
jgi:hypothetical protein